MARRIANRHRRRLVSGCLRCVVVRVARLLLFVVVFIGVRRPLPDSGNIDRMMPRGHSSQIGREMPESRRREGLTGSEELILPHIFAVQ
jgi:hypothetical protein